MNAANINQDERIRRIIDWRKYMTTIDDTDFFDIIRMYLGEVSTPYNKQDLVEKLSAFLRRDENKTAIVRLLSPIDLRLLAAIRYIAFPTAQKLENFFRQSMNRRQITDHINNLIQRLLIFYRKQEGSNSSSLCINPLLEELVASVLPVDILLPSYTKSTLPRLPESPAFGGDSLSVNVIASLLAYVLDNPELCKADGSLKKRNAQEVQDKIGREKLVQQLVTSLRNLGVLVDGYNGKGLVLDWKKAQDFASMDLPTQYSYLCAAAAGHLSKAGACNNAQLFYDTLSAAQKFYTIESLSRLSFLISQKAASDDLAPRRGFGGGRFQELIARSAASSSAYSSESSPAQSSAPAGDSGIMEVMLEAAVTFGFLKVEGYDDRDSPVYSVVPQFFECALPPDAGKKGSISIDSGFSVTVLPLLSLEDLLPLIQFLALVKCDRALTFEITKKSAMRSFDMGMKAQTIKDSLEKYTPYQLPQTLMVSLEEWFSSYASAALYKGYVLKLSGENELRVRRNPYLASHIVETFAPGVYLLDFDSDEEAAETIKKSGLDFIGKIKTKDKKQYMPYFFALRKTNALFDFSGSQEIGQLDPAHESEQKQFLEDLEAKVNSMNISSEQKEGLLFRIQRRLIVNQEQLRPESVRFERLEALGMDYQGKLHVIDSAISSKCLLEITCGEDEESVLGEIVSFSKQEGEAEVTLLTDDGEERVFSVSQASSVRKVTRPLSFS